MKKRKSNRIAALFASGVMFCGGIFASCSFLEPELSDYDKNALAVGIYLQQQEKLKAANASSSASGTTYETLTESRVSSTAPDTAGTITVSGAASYSGTSISEAWAAAAAVTSSGSTVLIEIPAGTYDLGTDQLAYKGSATIEIKGTGSNEYGSDVLIKTALENSKALNKSEQARSTISFQGSGNLILENLRIENTYAQTASGTAQLEIIGYDGSGYVAGYNCSFISGQDTMRTMGKAWFYHCYIEGDVDFLWMEYSNGGKVALYEDCRIRAISTRNSSARFTAPRVKASSTASYYKGLVIYNSKLEVEDGLKKVYLGRNIQYENNYDEYYENVSVVGCKLYGYLTDVWENKANSSSDIIFSGFNTDSYFPSNSNGSVYDSTTISNEFAGRNNILNRYYYAGGKSIAQAEEIWDINSLASDKNWNVTTDTSSSLLSGETEVTTTTYPLAELACAATTAKNSSKTTFSQNDSLTDGSSADENLTWTDLKYQNATYGTYASASSKLTLKVFEPSVVTWFSYKKNNGAITVTDSDGNTIVNAVKVSMASDGDVAFLYTGSGTTLTFTFTGTCYMDNLRVKTLTSESDEITSVTVAGSSSVSTTTGSSTYTATVIAPYISTDTSVIWSVSGSEATINSSTGVLAATTVGTVTVRATSVADSSKYDEMSVEITNEEKWPTSGQTYSYTTLGTVVTSSNYSSYYSDDTFLHIVSSGANGHGPIMKENSYFTIKVAGACTIKLGDCTYNSNSSYTITSSTDTSLSDTLTLSAGTNRSGSKTCSSYTEYSYSGSKAELKFSYTGSEAYLREVIVTPSN